MKVLALDTATNTGWAVFDDEKYVESGVMSFKKKRGESNGILFLKFRTWVSELILTTRPDIVAYEQAHFRGGAATEICVGLQTRVQEAAAQHEINCLPVTTSQVKKSLSGKGSASKEDQIAAARIIIGRAPLSDDEADAIGVALATYEEFNFF